ncbi:helix-turn-helix domain-containing protein [Streptomyces nodosus]|uniref:helix-turn-helix domain-containing protein n=1 Tax=Streptomyces nodosus TaxID=40318 RepID=UPI0036E11EFD
MTFEPEELGKSRQELGSMLRELRKAAGLSGDRLAVRCTMSQSKVSRIENGQTRPTLIDIEALLTALEAAPEVVTK